MQKRIVTHRNYGLSMFWPYISKGGFLVTDDIRLNDAFLDFATSFNVKPFIIKRVGVMQKP